MTVDPTNPWSLPGPPRRLHHVLYQKITTLINFTVQTKGVLALFILLETTLTDLSSLPSL